MADNPLEIPHTLRDVSEQNLKQAHAAYEQITDFMAKAMGAWTGAGALPSNPMAAVVKDVQDRATQIARENAESVFTFAGKMSNSHSPRYCDTSNAVCSRPDAGLRHADAATFQRDRRSSPAVGTRCHGRLGGRAALKSHARRLQGCAGPRHANRNGKCGVRFALVEKIAKAQNFQEALTLQTRFAQNQMQAYVTQTQEPQKLMGKLSRSCNAALLPDERTTSPLQARARLVPYPEDHFK